MIDLRKTVFTNQLHILNSTQRTHRLKKYFGLVHLTYLFGLFILFAKVKSRYKNLATFTLDEYYFRTSSEGVSNISDSNASRIPRIIHQSYKSLESLPTDWKETPSRWKSLHPKYEYKFWSDDDNHNLIKTFYPWFLKTYESYPAPIQQADAARYFAVLHFGGVYADMDILPTRDISPLLDRLNNIEAHGNAQMLVAETYNLGLTNALFAAVPNSTVLDKFVHQLPLHTKPLYGFERLNPHFGVLLSTGPTRLWIFLNNYRDKILTINPAGWGQCHQCKQKQCMPQKESFFETRKGGSWHKWDTRIMNFIFCHVHFVIWSFFCNLLIYWKVCRNKYAARHTEIPLVGNKNISDQKKIVYRDDKGKERQWNKQTNIVLSFESMNVFLYQIISQRQLSLFCAIVLLLVF